MTRDLAKYEMGLIYGLKTALQSTGRVLSRDDENRLCYLQEFLDNLEDANRAPLIEPPKSMKIKNYTDEIPF